MGWFCLFGFFVPLGNFSLKWRRYFYQWRAAKFDLYSRPLSSEGSLGCHHYCNAWHPFKNGLLRGPVTLTPIARRLAVELSLPVLTTWICRGWIRTPNPPHAGRSLYSTALPPLLKWMNFSTNDVVLVMTCTCKTKLIDWLFLTPIWDIFFMYA